jgi:hypothetical protein
MLAYVFDNAADAEAFYAAVNRALGYPNAETKTDEYASIWARPDGGAWAHLSDETVDRVVTMNAIQAPNPTEINEAEWFPPPMA